MYCLIHLQIQVNKYLFLNKGMKYVKQLMNENKLLVCYILAQTRKNFIGQRLRFIISPPSIIILTNSISENILFFNMCNNNNKQVVYSCQLIIIFLICIVILTIQTQLKLRWRLNILLHISLKNSYGRYLI